MMHLSIKQEEYGYGLFKDGEPWRYFKHGWDMIGLIQEIVQEGFTKCTFDGQMTEEESESFE